MVKKIINKGHNPVICVKITVNDMNIDQTYNG